ncbi:TPA: acetylxylan esterase [Candidatus Poribacteria bacterium]|nr:acetylxylan esterase [Candidatus Poribacteria bacterium]
MKKDEVSRQFSQPQYNDLGADEVIEPIFPLGIVPTMEAWKEERTALLRRWKAVLGTPAFDSFDRTQEAVEIFERPTYTGTIFKQATGPDTLQTLLLMEPKLVTLSPRSGIVVPFYDPDRMAGLDLKTHQPIAETSSIRFGYHLVQQGYVVVCTEAFPYNTVPEPEHNLGFAWWEQATEKLLTENPNWTGIAKLAWDTSLAIDLLLDQPDIDLGRIGVMGHSLGGKMAFYTGVFDQRVKVIVGSDFGLGFNFTNWNAPWYLGNQVLSPGFTLAHHHLLALCAPRSFFLVGGKTDRPASWQYIAEARKIYQLYDSSESIGFVDHAAGHWPTEESLRIAYQWLAEQFNLIPQPWML